MRLKELSTGRPQWYTIALLKTSRRHYGHLGWIDLDTGQTVGLSPLRWQENLQDHGRRGRESRDGQLLCLRTWADNLQLWSLSTDVRLRTYPLEHASDLLATPQGCAVRSEGAVRFFPARPGPEKGLVSSGVQAWGQSPDGLVIAHGKKISFFDDTGALQKEWPLPQSGITTMLADDTTLFLGQASGQVTVHPRSQRPEVVLGGFSSAPVTRLAWGPSGTLLAGFENGIVGLWDLNNGDQLLRHEMQGAIVDIQRTDTRWHFVSRAGDLHTWDLATFMKEYCEVLKSLWRQTPLGWQNGGLMPSSVPGEHHCSPP